jgi:hypothetical protein
MEIKLNHKNSLPEHILKVLEKYWDISLPKEYRSFLIHHNGGEPEKSCFNFKDQKKEGSDVRFFLGIYPDNDRDLLNKIKIYENRIPKNTFPIACDSFGNLIIISVKNKDRGKIYFWDHEMEANTEAGEIADYTNLTLIADSFDEFINGLHSFDENKESEND